MRNQKSHGIRLLFVAAVVATYGLVFSSAHADVIGEWASIKTPPPPALKPVTVGPKTALLMLDFMKQNCGVRPRCVATVPTAKKLLTAARAAKVEVIHSRFGKTTVADTIDADLAPVGDEPSVISFSDKFVGTDLEKILKDKGIETVIAVGTAANGAVLYTGSGAALRGMKVIVPVDVISSLDIYTEQLGAWQLANIPTFAANVTLTRFDMMKF